MERRSYEIDANKKIERKVKSDHKFETKIGKLVRKLCCIFVYFCITRENNERKVNIESIQRIERKKWGR